MNDVWKWLGEQVGNILGVAGLVTGFIFWWISRRPKRFGWQVLNHTPIISHSARWLPLKVVYDGQDVDSPNLIMVRVGNVGKAEIRGHDFDGPVRIDFKEGRILAVGVNDTSVPDISPDLEQAPNSVAFTPSLLNAGEWIDLQFVTDGPPEMPAIHARVAGQTAQMVDIKEERQRTWLPVLLGGLGLVIVASLMTLLGDSFRTFALVAGVVGLLALPIGIFGMDRRLGWSKKAKAAKER